MTTLMQWARHHLPRLGTTLHQRCLAPVLAVLRWEGVILLAGIGLASLGALATRWLFVFGLIAALLLGLAWGRALAPGARGQRFRRQAERFGLGLWSIGLVVIGLAIFWRFSTARGASLFGGVYLLLGVIHIIWLARHRTVLAGQFKQVIALSVTPIVLAWILNSVIYAGYVRFVGAKRTVTHQTLAVRLEARRRQLDSWRDAGHLPVAVALSGGGYRAAVAHAGLLWALQEAKIPIHYLTTVSGGSIVGASYALGWSPRQFCDHLKRSKPGLPNDLANFLAVFKLLVVPSYGSGDTYAGHFDRVYFHGATLAATGPPVLILNTTRYADGTRVAFWPGHGPPKVKLARLVAASGAFPVAFDPVHIGHERYVDGGVVDNLGLAGLEQHFSAVAGDAQIDRLIPRVLIISDEGIIPAAPRSWRKPSVPQMAIHAQKTSYFAMHKWIYSFYTAGRYDRTSTTPLEQPYAVKAGRLWPDLPQTLRNREVQVFVLSPASPAERGHFAGTEPLLDAVSSLQTLEELSPEEVDAAFWVAARLAAVYMPKIAAAAGGSA